MQMKNYLIKFRKAVILAINTVLIVGAYIGAFYIRFDFKLPVEYRDLIISTLPGLLVIKLVVFYYFGLYSGLWRYVSMDDLLRIIKANIVSTSCFIVFVVFLHGFVGFPRSIFVLDLVLCIGFLSGVRLLTRLLREGYYPIPSDGAIKTLIVGAGESGILVLKELRHNKKVDIIGFIDDDASKKGMHIHGKKIFGNRTQMPEIVTKHNINEIIIAIPSARGSVIRDIISNCQFPGVKVKIVPGLSKIISGEVEIKLREVRPEDLLGRETIKIDKGEISRYVRDKVILITGAGGSIGSEIAKQALHFSPKQLILIDYNESDLYFLQREMENEKVQTDIHAIAADFKDIGVLKHVFSRFNPQIIFHAAAFKHVPLMETNPSSAVKNNVIGSRNIIYAAEHYGVESFVLISSDKAVNPTSVMGATKRISEMILQAKSGTSKTKFIAVRFGNVLGSKGSVVPLFRKQIEENGRVTITHPDAKRYFMSVYESVQLVLQASAIGKGGEIFILDMGDQIRIKELAENLIILSGLRPGKDVKIDYIGLRQGEKLSEEMILDLEKDKATRCDKIFVTQPGEVDIHKIIKQVKELEKLADLMDNTKIIEKIKEIVPSYTPPSILR